jgi:hypothetical protein
MPSPPHTHTLPSIPPSISSTTISSPLLPFCSLSSIDSIPVLPPSAPGATPPHAREQANRHANTRTQARALVRVCQQTRQHTHTGTRACACVQTESAHVRPHKRTRTRMRTHRSTQMCLGRFGNSWLLQSQGPVQSIDRQGISCDTDGPLQFFIAKIFAYILKRRICTRKKILIFFK